MTQHLTRRAAIIAALTIGAALTTAAAAAVAVAGVLTESDPIFAAIEAHRAAFAGQAGEMIVARALALCAVNLQHVELADWV